MKWYRTPLAAAVMGALSPCAFAETEAEAEANKLPEVTVRQTADTISSNVATRLPASAMETPFTVTSVDGDLIENTGANNLSDVMRYAAIVGGTDNFGNSGEFFSSRGFQLAAGSNYFRDGLRYRKYGQVPLYDIERVEFLRGPASVLYGALEPGGVVNIVSRQPQKTFGASAALKLGQDDYRRATVDITGPINDQVRYRLQALDLESDSFRDVVTQRAKGVTGQVDIDLTSDTLLSLRASHYSDRRTGDRGTVLATRTDGSVGFADVPRSRFLGERYAQFNFRDTNLSAGLRHRFNDQWQLRADLVHSRQDEDRTYMWFLADNSPVGTNGLLRRQVGDWDATLRGSLGRVETVGTFATGDLTHRLLVGAEFERFTNRRTNNRYDTNPINIYNPVYSPTRPANGKQTLASVFAERFDSNGLYVQNMMNWRDAITVLVGARYDSVDSKDPDTKKDRDHSKGLTPQFGVVFHPTPWISPYISYTRSFLPQDGTDRNGNRFDPQKSRQWEAGVKLDLQDQKTFVTLAAYQLEKRNLKMTDPDDPSFSRLSGLRRSKGIEAAVHSKPLPGLNLTANWAYAAEAKFIEDNKFAGNTTPNVPRHALGLFADYNFQGDWNQWGASAGLTYVGQRQGTDNNSFQLPSYTLLDLGVRYRATRNVIITASVKNITDRTFYTGSINATTIGVGTPRRAYVGLEWRM